MESLFNPEPLPTGTTVDYHGSQMQYHGRYILAQCDCVPCQDLEHHVRLNGGRMEPRYQLTPLMPWSWLSALEHVSPASITPLAGPEASL